MNKRIQELAIEAGGGPSRWYTDPDVLEYFSTLIVRECAMVAMQKQTENDLDGIVSENPAKDFARALIKHFGVE